MIEHKYYASKTPEEWISRRHPVDDLEPTMLQSDAIRDARLQTVRLLNALAGSIEGAISKGNIKGIQTAFWGAAYGLGLNVCQGVSMTQRALSLGVERAALSKRATSFCSANGLDPSFLMKRESYLAYREARLEVIANSANGSNGAEQKAK
jgi:hypothetical protein